MYYENQKRNYQKELKLINLHINGLDIIYGNQEQFMFQNSEYLSFLTPEFHVLTTSHENWIHQNNQKNISYPEYQKNNSHPEKLIHRTLAGHYVRSKSEAIIANALFSQKIPYRYECGLQIDNITFFPDFTIMHPITKKVIYWEHFGMMGNPDYAKQTFHKLGKYTASGIIPTIHMIITFETLEEPIDSVHIQHLIDEYFGE